MNRRDLDALHGRLTALEVLMVLVLAQRGPNALRQTIAALESRQAPSVAEAQEIRVLTKRLRQALAALDEDVSKR